MSDHELADRRDRRPTSSFPSVDRYESERPLHRPPPSSERYRPVIAIWAYRVCELRGSTQAVNVEARQPPAAVGVPKLANLVLEAKTSWPQ